MWLEIGCMWLCWPCDRQAPSPGCTLDWSPNTSWDRLNWITGSLTLTVVALGPTPQFDNHWFTGSTSSSKHEQLTAPAVLLLATRGCSSKWIPISCHVKMSSVTALNVYRVNTLNVINSGSKTLMTRDQNAKTSECDYVCLLYTVCGLFLCRLSSRAPTVPSWQKSIVGSLQG